jgi:hypothetical protein
VNNKSPATAWRRLFLTALVAALPGEVGAVSRAPAKVALVYNGKYADNDAYKALAKQCQKAGLTVRSFSTPEQLVSKLNGATLLAIGGTVDDINPFTREFKPHIVRACQKFVNDGGRYLGICGGAYMALSGWREDGRSYKAMDLVPVKGDSFKENQSDMVIMVQWRNQKRPMYYQYGPKFMAVDPKKDKILARYADGSIAALIRQVGRGKVLLCGPHPEADSSWITKKTINRNAWKNTDDLAADMMKELMSDSR